MYGNELYHYGRKGQKWYVRLFQNYDGSLTPAGRERYRKNSSGEGTDANDEQERYKSLADQNKNLLAEAMRRSTDGIKKGDKPSELGKSTDISDLSDKELQDLVNRLRNEDAYKSLTNPKPTTSSDKKTEYRDANHMTDAELQAAYNRLNTQDNYEKLLAKRAPKSFAQEFVEAGKKAAKEALIGIGTNLVKDAINNSAEKLGRAIVNGMNGSDKGDNTGSKNKQKKTTKG